MAKETGFRSINIDSETHMDIGVFSKQNRRSMWECMRDAWQHYRSSDLAPLPADMTPQEHQMVAGLLSFVRSTDHDDLVLRHVMQEFLNHLMARESTQKTS